MCVCVVVVVVVVVAWRGVIWSSRRRQQAPGTGRPHSAQRLTTSFGPGRFRSQSVTSLSTYDYARAGGDGAGGEGAGLEGSLPYWAGSRVVAESPSRVVVASFTGPTPPGTTDANGDVAADADVDGGEDHMDRHAQSPPPSATAYRRRSAMT